MKYKKKLAQKSNSFIQKLKSYEIESKILENTFAEYSVKLSVQKDSTNFGHIVLYHKPTNDTYSIKFHELKNKSIVQELETIWNSLIEAPIDVSSGLIAFVDGSYMNKKTSYAAIILRDGKSIHELGGVVSKEIAQNSHQVAGELFSVMEVIKWCSANLIDSITIVYDYIGIEKFGNGSWKPNQKLTFEYQSFIRQTDVKINWIKIKSHSNFLWNDKVDELAKKYAQ